MKKIIVSACLLGERCRFDGLSKPNEHVIALKNRFELIPVCAEELGGLKTPRPPAEIVGNRVVRVDGVDVTKEYKKGAQCVLKIATDNNCKIAVLKARSPSCGSGFIYDGTYTKTLKEGNGICAQLLIDNGILVLDERSLERINYEDNSE